VLTTQHPPSAKVGTNFADKSRSLGIVHSRTMVTEVLIFLHAQDLTPMVIKSVRASVNKNESPTKEKLQLQTQILKRTTATLSQPVHLEKR
jgi:hypothetical protein